MAIAGNISIAFGADPRAFISAAEKVRRGLKQVGVGADDTKGALERLQSGFASIGKSAAMGLAAPVAAATALAGAVTAAGAALWKFTREGANIIDPIAKMSDTLGMGTGELMGLVHGADLAGASADTLSGALKKMMRGIAAGGPAFAALGLDAVALKGMGTAKAFETVAERIRQIQDPAQRVAAAVSVFGKSGADLLPLIMGGAEGMQAAAAEAKALGYHVDRIDAMKLESFNDALSKMGRLWEGIKIQVAKFLGPILEAGLSRVVEWLKETGGASVWVEKAFDAVMTGLTGFLDGLSFAHMAWQKLKVGFLEFRAATITGLEDLANTAIDTFNSIVEAFNRIPGVKLALAPKFKISGSDDVRAAAEREAAKLADMEQQLPLGARFMRGFASLKNEGDQKARDALASITPTGGFDPEEVLKQDPKGKQAIEKIGKDATTAAKGFDTLAKSAEAAHEAIRGDNKAGTGSLMTTAFPAVGSSQVGPAAGGSHMNIPQMNVPHMGGDSEAAILQQMVGYLRQMTHQLSTAPTLRTA